MPSFVILALLFPGASGGTADAAVHIDFTFAQGEYGQPFGAAFIGIVYVGVPTAAVPSAPLESFLDGQKANDLQTDGGGKFLDTLSSLAPGNHTYQVKAAAGTPAEAASRLVRFYVSLRPGAPQNLTATPGPNYDRIALAWSAPLTPYLGSYGYTIYRNSNWVGHVSRTSPRFNDTVGPGENLSYRVSADNAAGEGPGASVQTRSIMPDLPGIPGNLTVVAGPDWADVNLTWQASTTSNGATVTYDVWRKAPGETAFSRLTMTTGTKFRDSVEPSTTYAYRVDPRNAAGAGPSAFANVTSVAAPPDELDVFLDSIRFCDASRCQTVTRGHNPAPMSGDITYRTTQHGTAKIRGRASGSIDVDSRIDCCLGGVGDSRTISYTAAGWQWTTVDLPLLGINPGTCEFVDLTIEGGVGGEILAADYSSFVACVN